MARNTKLAMLDLFLDRTAGETYSGNRLVTRANEDDSVSLIAYGWLKLAEYSESDNEVTVFTGHSAIQSVTISRYLNDVVSRADERGRSVVLSGESPTVSSPNAGVEYIGNYISMTADKSAVDRDAQRDVEAQLKTVA